VMGSLEFLGKVIHNIIGSDVQQGLRLTNIFRMIRMDHRLVIVNPGYPAMCRTRTTWVPVNGPEMLLCLACMCNPFFCTTESGSTRTAEKIRQEYEAPLVICLALTFV
jgi:hypothetical protein